MKYEEDDLFEIVNIEYPEYQYLNGEIVSVIGTSNKGRICGCGQVTATNGGAIITLKYPAPCGCTEDLISWEYLKKIDKSKFKESEEQINKLFDREVAL